MINFFLSFVLITVMFALIYKVMPQARVRWRDVWVGATTTSMLFTAGKEAIGLYLGRSGTVSAFGAVDVVLVWVYYSAQIFFFGAEFTWICSKAHPRAAVDRQPAPADRPPPFPKPRP